MDYKVVRFLVCLSVGYITCCKRTGWFKLTTDSDLLSEELKNIDWEGDGDLACVRYCYRSSSCIASVWDKVAGQCRLFASHQTLSTTGWTDATSEVYIFQNPCGPLRVSVSETYTKKSGLVTTRAVCDETEYFYGTDQMTSCDLVTSQWTTQTGQCKTQVAVTTFPGMLLRPPNSTLIIDATVTGNKFTVTVTAGGSATYALRLAVILSSSTVLRNTKVNEVFDKPELSLSSGFPFTVGMRFTMSITSNIDAFVCTLDGDRLFTFDHRLPRDSVDSIKIEESIDLHAVLYE